MEETLRVLVTLGFALLLMMLRLEAERFGAAEYDEAGEHGEPPSLRRRLAWYAIGIALTVAIWRVHPDASGELFLRLGDRSTAVLGGLALGAAGTGLAFSLAWARYRHIRLPELRSYPGALLNAVVTAFIDEAAFRGILLGFLLLAGLDSGPAIAMQAILYGLATRLGAPGRDLGMLGLTLLIGLAAGWLTVASDGIGAAFLGHAIARVAIFLATGHAGRVAARGREVEEIERAHRPPSGWRVIGARGSARDR